MGRHWLLVAIAIVVLVAAAVTLAVTRTPPRPTYPGQAQAAGAGSATAKVSVPPPLPGEPSIGADREVMLQKFAANLSHGIYTHANLLFLLCNSEAGRAVANQAGDPMTMALMRRMTALFRSAPGMAHAACPSPPPQTP